MKSYRVAKFLLRYSWILALGTNVYIILRWFQALIRSEVGMTVQTLAIGVGVILLVLMGLIAFSTFHKRWAWEPTFPFWEAMRVDLLKVWMLVVVSLLLDLIPGVVRLLDA
jgi:hypothetical protein